MDNKMQLRKVTIEDGYIFYEQPNGTFTDGQDGQIDLMYFNEAELLDNEFVGIRKIEFYTRKTQ